MRCATINGFSGGGGVIGGRRAMRRVVSEARGLTTLPALNGSARLRTLRADRARLAHLPPALCAHAPQLRSLYVLVPPAPRPRGPAALTTPCRVSGT